MERSLPINNIFKSNYKWYILSLTMLTYAIVAGAERMCMPVLFPEISDKIGLSIVEVGTIWGLDPLAGVFIGLPGGLLADRFGIKRTLMVVCLLAGVFSALRGFSFNFVTLATTTFIFGIMSAAAPSIVPKTTAVWFSSKQLAITNALLNAAWAVGAMFATMSSAVFLSPWLGGWKNVMFFYGAPAVILGLLWWLTGREPKKHEAQAETVSAVPFRQSLSIVARNKQVWIMGFIALTLWGANMGLNGYLPTYLRNAGWSPESADSAMTVLLATNVVGIVPMVLLANRLNSQKGMFVFSLVIMTVSLVVIPLATSPAAMWPLLIISGILRSAFPALMNTLVFEFKGVGGTYGGTAIGLASSLGMLGSCIAPPAGNSLAAFDPGAPFYFWAALSGLGIPAFFILRKMMAGKRPIRYAEMVSGEGK